jgi:hypothetical protein
MAVKEDQSCKSWRRIHFVSIGLSAVCNWRISRVSWARTHTRPFFNESAPGLEAARPGNMRRASLEALLGSGQSIDHRHTPTFRLGVLCTVFGTRFRSYSALPIRISRIRDKSNDDS